MPDFYREGTVRGARFQRGYVRAGCPIRRLVFFLLYVAVNAHAHVRRVWYYPTGARIYRLRTSSDRMQTNNRSRFVVNF